MQEDDPLRDVLLNEYTFMQKSYELQFTHFMGVFYFWTAVIMLPTGAGILANVGVADPQKNQAFGILCMFVALVGLFLSTKMFDIRRSQVRYLERTNLLRNALWERYEIEKGTGIAPMGKGVDLIDVAKSDFGRSMALVMSLIHGVLFGVGVWCFLKPSARPIYVLLLAIVAGAALFRWNDKLFFRLIGRPPSSPFFSWMLPSRFGLVARL